MTARLSVRRVWPPREEGMAFLIIARQGVMGTIHKLYTRNQFVASLCRRAEENQHADLWVTWSEAQTITQVEPVTGDCHVA